MIFISELNSESLILVISPTIQTICCLHEVIAELSEFRFLFKWESVLWRAPKRGSARCTERSS